MRRAPIQSELDYKNLFESSPDLYLVLKPDFTIVAASDSYLRVTMLKREQVLDRNIFDVFPDNPDDPDVKASSHLRASFERVLKFKKPDYMPTQKYDVRRPEISGGHFEEKHWNPLSTPIFDKQGSIQYILHRVEDVTDFVKLKNERVEQFLVAEQLREKNKKLESLRQSQRLEAMGSLAGGVAHDFNNIIAIILLTCESALKEGQISEEVQRHFRQVSLSAKTAAALVRQLLTFSRQQVLQPQVLNTNDVIKNLQPLLSRLLTENIDFQVDLDPQTANIWVDQGQLEQVILNLVINSKDALPLGGQIRITSTNIQINEHRSALGFKVEPGPYNVIEITDDGVGMDSETQARAFEPFFTTKGNRGTGLGLATVYGIVNQNRGLIEIQSVIGNGTHFKIYFPVTDKPIERKFVIPKVSSLVQSFSHNKTLLVVEDQEILRELMCEMLESLNFIVHKAENGVEALNKLAELNYKVDLIITDVVMPIMGGQALTAKLAASGHKFKFLYLSGFAGDMIADKSISPLDNFLQKPFEQSTLIEKINQILSDKK